MNRKDPHVTALWAPMLCDCRAGGASQNPAQLQYWEKKKFDPFWSFQDSRSPFTRTSKVSKYSPPAAYAKVKNRKLLSVETANKYLIQRSAGQSCSCCCWSIKKEQSSNTRVLKSIRSFQSVLFILYFVKLLSLLVNLPSRLSLFQPTFHQSAFDRCKHHPRPATCSWEQVCSWWKLYDGYSARKEICIQIETFMVP